jgi:hypothetical protein
MCRGECDGDRPALRDSEEVCRLDFEILEHGFGLDHAAFDAVLRHVATGEARSLLVPPDDRVPLGQLLGERGG